VQGLAGNVRDWRGGASPRPTPARMRTIVCVSVRACVRLSLCLSVCVCACARVSVRVRVCVFMYHQPEVSRAVSLALYLLVHFAVPLLAQPESMRAADAPAEGKIFKDEAQVTISEERKKRKKMKLRKARLFKMRLKL
jgi:hypothetical protein